MNLRTYFLAFVVTTIFAMPALANDLRPPDYRSSPRSTVAGWDFLTQQEPSQIKPDANVPLLVGPAAEFLQAKFSPNSSYPLAALFGDVAYTSANGGGYFGQYSDNGGIVFVVPNEVYVAADEYMRLRIQVTYQGIEPPTTVIGYSDIPGNSQEVKEIPILRIPVNDPSLPPNSSFFYEDWELHSSPTWEQVVVFAPEETQILHVVIDTISKKNPIFDNGFEPGEISPWPPK